MYKLTEILDALNNNYPVIIGTLVYDSFDRTGRDNGIVSIPTELENVLGGHAMCLVGYDMRQRLLLARNSFGEDWGLKGYCWIPFDYAEQNFMDMWVIDLDLIGVVI